MTALRAYIAASFVAAIIAGAGFVYLAGKSHERERLEREAAIKRIENITTGQEINNDVQNMDDASIGDDLDKRLSDGGQ